MAENGTPDISGLSPGRYAAKREAEMKAEYDPNAHRNLAQQLVLAVWGGLQAALSFVQIFWAEAEITTKPLMRFRMQSVDSQNPNVLPGAQDLVRMELREVFRTLERAEQLAEPPSDDFIAYMSKLGFSRHMAESFWAAHWSLPSVGDAFEMFHRLRPGAVPENMTFTETDLMQLLKRQDVLKAYRERIIAIAYSPFTRVDVRRMNKLGVINREQTVSAYMDLGYDATKAELLTQFTEKDNLPEERGVSRGDMATAYVEGIIGREELVLFLQSMGYPSRDIDIFMQLTELRMKTKGTTKADRSLTKADVTSAYTNGVYSKTQAIQALLDLGFSAEESSTIMTTLEAKLAAKKK